MGDAIRLNKKLQIFTLMTHLTLIDSFFALNNCFQLSVRVSLQFFVVILEQVLQILGPGLHTVMYLFCIICNGYFQSNDVLVLVSVDGIVFSECWSFVLILG